MHICSLRETLSFYRDPAGFTAGAGLRLGDVYAVRSPGPRLWVATDPGIAEAVLVTKAACFEKSRIYWRELRRTIGDSMGSLDGPRWEYLHNKERPYFTPGAVRAFLPRGHTAIVRQFDQLARRIESEPRVAVLDVLSELSARVTLAALFGRDDESAALEIARRIADGHAILDRLTRYPFLRPLVWRAGIARRARNHRAFFDVYVEQLRRSHSSADSRSLLDALVGVQTDPDAPRYPEALIRNEVMFHLGASTETQAVAAGWTLLLLSRHRDALQRLRAEIGRVAGTAGITSQHIPELMYTKQVIQEALRCYPPVYAIARDCVESTELLGNRIDKGQVVLISVYGVHRNPRLWDHPDRFDPDRFEPGRAGAIAKYQYLPFGAGKHVCIGQHMALPLMVLTVAEFAQRFDWTFPDADVRATARPSLKPSGAFVVTLTRRA